MNSVRLTYEAFQRDSDIGVLAALDTLLTVAQFTLRTAKPKCPVDEATEDAEDLYPDPEATAFDELIEALEHLAWRIDRYVNPSHWTDDEGLDLPF